MHQRNKESSRRNQGVEGGQKKESFSKTLKSNQILGGSLKGNFPKSGNKLFPKALLLSTCVIGSGSCLPITSITGIGYFQSLIVQCYLFRVIPVDLWEDSKGSLLIENT